MFRLLCSFLAFLILRLRQENPSVSLTIKLHQQQHQSTQLALLARLQTTLTTKFDLQELEGRELQRNQNIPSFAGRPRLNIKLSLPSRSMKFQPNHLVFDWVTVLGALVLFLLLEHGLSPFHRLFSLDDETIQFPHAVHERVPVWLLFIIAYLIPALTIALHSLIMRRGWRMIHISILGLTAATALTVFATALIKNGVGRPRPDLLDRCQPLKDTPATGLVDVSVCTTTNAHFLDEGFRSFPSGHSSYAFAGLGFLACWLSGQVKLFKAPPRSWKSFICFAPLVGAAMVAVTRTEDYRHHWQDVTVGGIMGIIIAYFAYRQYFPSLHSQDCDQAHAETVEAVATNYDGLERGQPEFSP